MRATKPLAGARVMGSLHMTVQTAVLIETLAELGADVRWVSCNIFSTQDHAAAAVAVGRPETGGTPASPRARRSSPGRARRSRSTGGARVEALGGRTAAGPTLIVDDGGDATLFVHKGVEYEKRGQGAGVQSRDRAGGVGRHPRHAAASSWKRIPAAGREVAKGIRGVSEETTTGVHRLYQMMEAGTLLFPAINVNDSVTKSKFDNIYGCRHSLPDGLDARHRRHARRQGRRGVRLRRSRQGLRAGAARPGLPRDRHRDRSDLRAAGRDGGLRGDDARGRASRRADIFITATGNLDIITVEHMASMKDKAIVGNIGHFDNEIDMAGLKKARASSGSTSSRSTTSGVSRTAIACWSWPRGGC